MAHADLTAPDTDNEFEALDDWWPPAARRSAGLVPVTELGAARRRHHVMIRRRDGSRDVLREMSVGWRIERNHGRTHRTRTPQRTGARRRGAGRPAGRRAATRTSSSSGRGDPHLADGDPEPPGPRRPRGPSA